MHPEVESLANATQEIADFLLSVNEKHWGEWLAKDAELMRKLDFRGIEHLLSAFGGMGSINDLILSPLNGHKIEESQASELNKSLEKRLSEITRCARKLYYEEVVAIRRT